MKPLTTEIGDATVDTCKVYDGRYPYETGIKHPQYNTGHWVIVESYISEESAKEGHERWVKAMTSDVLPSELKDCSNSLISRLGAAFGLPTEFPREVPK